MSLLRRTHTRVRAIAKAILIQLTAYSLDVKLVPTARLALHYTIVYYFITLVLALRTYTRAPAIRANPIFLE